MKNLKKSLCMLLALGLTITAALLATACKKDKPPQQDPHELHEIDYKVTVVDNGGNPLQNVVVKLYNNGNQRDMALVNEQGVATFKLPPADYTVSFDSPGKSFTFDTAKCVLSATVTELTATLYDTLSDTVQLYNDYNAYAVGEGSFMPALVPNDITYFVFVPTRAGIYKVSVNNAALDLGDYGAPSYIRESKIDPQVKDSYEIVVKSYNVGSTPAETTQYLIGIHTKDTGATSCIFSIEHVGTPTVTPEELPWDELQPTAGARPADFIHYLNWKPTFHNLDVTDPNLTVVFNEADGYYHYGTADGPVVMVRIASESPYLPSFVKICESDPLRVYFYDENGEFLRKENYYSLITAYAAMCNEDGVVPLNKQLEYVIKSCGDYKSWWDFGKGLHIFGSDIADPDTAWLFACGYYTVEKDGAGAEAPAKLIAATTEKVLQEGGSTLHFTAETVNDATLTLQGLTAGSTVTVGNTTYTAETAALTVTLEKNGTKAFSVTLQGTGTAEYTLTLTVTESV